MTNLDIYFSDACNSNCQYCIMQDKENNSNTAIRQALEDNTFVTNVRHVLTPETISIGFWGREPSVNGQYFSNFICNLLEYSPYIRYIMIPTNGQSDTFYQDFVIPLYCYCNSHKRRIILMLQFSLDGPPDLHDKYRGEGSAKKCIDTIDKVYHNFNFQNKYLRIRMSTKSTLQGYELEHYSPIIWRNYMRGLNTDYPNKEEVGYFYSRIGWQRITFEVPGNYTVEQGRVLSKWKEYIHIEPEMYQSCAVNTDSKTIDYLGNLYDCHLLVNKDVNQEILRAQFETTMNTLVAANEAIEQDRNKLFNAISSIYCWGATDKRLDSYIRLLGNGFLL